MPIQMTLAVINYTFYYRGIVYIFKHNFLRDTFLDQIFI